MASDLTGQKFGRWTILSLAGKSARGKSLWQAVCECGTSRSVEGSNLRSGGSRSCGCLKDDLARIRLSKGFDTSSSEYKSWYHFKERCNNPNNKDYASYGGRGISYQKSWDVYANFLKDMGPKPVPGLELERKNNNKNYTKANCRWASRKEQNRNKRNTRWVLLNRRKISLAEAAELVGQDYSKLITRIRRGQSIGYGITLPKINNKR